MLINEGRNAGEYEIQFSFDYLYTFRIFEFGGEIYVQVWKQRGYDLIEEMFVTAAEAKNLILLTGALWDTIRFYPGEDGWIWEKKSGDQIRRVEFPLDDYEFIREHGSLFDKGIDWVKSRVGADWTPLAKSVKKPEYNFNDMYYSRKDFFTNYR